MPSCMIETTTKKHKTRKESPESTDVWKKFCYNIYKNKNKQKCIPKGSKANLESNIDEHETLMNLLEVGIKTYKKERKKVLPIVPKCFHIVYLGNVSN